MMTIIVLVALMAMTMEEMSEESSTSFAMEEPTRMARVILNNNKSSTKFFMKENNKDEGVSCFDGLYNVPRKEENVLGKKNKENSEIKSQSQRRKSGLVWEKQDKKGEFSLSNMWVCAHNTFHSTSYPMASGGSSPFCGEEVMAITSGRGCKDTALPINFKPTQKALSLPFFQRGGYLYHLLEVGGNGRTKKRRMREENDFNQK